MRTVYDFIIVGAGPAGLLAAYDLKKEGFSVLVLDAQEQIKRKVCGEYLCPKGVEFLETHGHSDLLKDFEKLYGMKIFSPNQTYVESFFSENNDKRYGVSINRKIFEERLYSKYQALGGIVNWGEPVMGIENIGTNIIVKTETGAYCGRFLIGADGRKSRVAKHYDLEVSKKNNRVAVHAYFKPKVIQSRMGQMHLFSDGSYIGINPIHSNEVNVSLVCDIQKIKKNKDLKQILNEYIQNSKFLSEQIGLIEDGVRIYSVFPLHHEVKRTGGYNFALIGDAAGFIDPLTGEGLYNAILTASILCEKIIEQRKKNYFSIEAAVKEYMCVKDRLMNEKNNLNTMFQKILNSPWLLNFIANHLKSKQKRANAFIGIIGNLQTPLRGLTKVIF